MLVDADRLGFGGNGVHVFPPRRGDDSAAWRSS
jgi:hypothetical protein